MKRYDFEIIAAMQEEFEAYIWKYPKNGLCYKSLKNHSKKYDMK